MLAHDFLLNRRTVVVGGDVTPVSIDTAVQGLFELTMQDEKTPIRVVFDSRGGDMQEAMRFASIVQSWPVPIHGVVVGLCYSAAFLMLQACHVRIGLPMSLMGDHYGAAGIQITGENARQDKAGFKNALAQIVDMNKATAEFYAIRTGMKVKRVERILKELGRFDRWLTSKSAKKLSFLDRIDSDWKL